ncbi:MAG TPA: hypothetical protein VMM79_04185 [Longimicrobiales bacterium]|nr:hypothetical protein [Longimicrobiales bacterium]
MTVVRPARKRNRLTENRRIRDEPTTPQRVREYYSIRASPGFSDEIAAHRWRHAKHIEERWRDLGADQPLRLRTARHDEAVVAVRGNIVQSAARLPDVQIVGRRDRAVAAAFAVGLPHLNQPIRGRVRQRSQEHGVHHAEDRRVRADAERERDDGDGRHTGMPGQTSAGEAQVVPDLVHFRPPNRFASSHATDKSRACTHDPRLSLCPARFRATAGAHD